MTAPDDSVYWKGKPIEECSWSELIECARFMHKALRLFCDPRTILNHDGEPSL